MYKENTQKGLRCTVCTNCGRCPGVRGPIHVVTQCLEKPRVDLQNDQNLRLITVDVGTTTIAMQLHGTDGTVQDRYVAVNPQTKYGADVISRITAAEKRDAAEDMRRLVVEQLEKGVARFQRCLSGAEEPVMILAANTTMVYLLMGRNPAELGQAPFRATHTDAVCTKIAGVACYIMPCLSAFVGGDIVAGIYACRMQKYRELTLLVDLGTNGEMVLGNHEKILACATAAGPAFEGGANCGVWGADMVRLMAEMLRKGLMDNTGLLADPYFDRGVRIGNVLVTQEAVRAIQLAKAAIAVGVKLLCERYGCVPENIDRVILAGGFGYYLNPADASAIGLLPAKLCEKAVSGGNTALAGALCIGEKLIKGEDFWQITDLSENGNCQWDVMNLAEEASFAINYYEATKF